MTTQLTTTQIQSLKSELEGIILQTAAGLKRAGEIWKQLEDAGEDMVEFKNRASEAIRLVAYGQLLPEIVFMPLSLTTRNAVGKLAIPDQRKIAGGESVTVVYDLSGTPRQVPVASLTPKEVRQVFAGDKIRTEIEQLAWLKSLASAVATLPRHKIKIDKARHGADLRGFFTPTELRDIINDLEPKRK